MSVNAAVEKALKLQQEFETARSEAVQTLLKQRDDIGEQLKALGYEAHEKPKAAKRAVDPEKKCPLCGENGHDARRHKGETRQH